MTHYSINDTMETKRSVNITLDKAKEYYKSGGELKKIALQAFATIELEEALLPKTWEELMQGKCCESGDPINVKYIALMKLEKLRDQYRMGWLPDWNENKIKWCIAHEKGEFIVTQSYFREMFLSFPRTSTAKQFLSNFNYLLKEAEDLI